MRSSLLALMLVIGLGQVTIATAENSPPPSGPNEPNAVWRQKLEEQCHSTGHASESAILCFLDAAHQAFETGQINNDILQPLLMYGNYKLTFERGYHLGFNDGRNSNTPPPQSPTPPPPAPPQPTPTPSTVAICHNNDGKAWVTIRVPSELVNQYLAKGDKLGECKPSGGSASVKKPASKPKKKK